MGGNEAKVKRKGKNILDTPQVLRGHICGCRWVAQTSRLISHKLRALGDMICDARKAAGLTQDQLAGRVRIGTATLKYIESGDRAPSLPVAVRIIDELHLDVLKVVDTLR